MSKPAATPAMTPARFRRVRDVFVTAARLADLEQDAYISEACNDDPTLEREVRELLTLGDTDDEKVDALVASVAQGLANAINQDAAVETVGPYRLLSSLGRGGMGSVWLAERDDGHFEQKVAIKFVDKGRATPELVNRFRSERQILAVLDHPGIARLLDGGETDNGVPFIVMEYVDGTPVDQYCDERKLPIPERLALFIEICKAIEYAHRNLVVHRDIKASNVLITADGEPKLLDFGIAKLLDLERARAFDMQLTSDASRILTPATASPEQLRGRAVTTASDVYSLGHLLYRLLTGAMPYVVDSTDRFALPQAILDDEAVWPSKAALSEADARARCETPDRLAWRLAGDLDAIVLKALRKSPEDRYAAPRDLAEDIERHLAHRPVKARGEALGYTMRRFAVRNRAPLAVAASVVVLIGALVAYYTAEVAAERDRARTEARHAEEAAAFLSDLFEVSTPDESRGMEVTAREILDRGAERIGSELTSEPLVQISLMNVIGMAYSKLGLYDTAAETLEQALERHEALDLPNNAELGTTLHNLGLVYLIQASYDKSRPLLDRALAVRRAALGPAHTDIIATLLAQASQSYELAEHERASDYLDEAEAVVRAVEPADPLALADVLIARADLEAKLGDYDAAIANYRAALDLRLEISGDDHPATLVARNNLAGALIGAGRNAEAEIMLREIVADRRRVLPPGHADLATALQQLSASLKYQGRPEEALPWQEEALAIQRAVHKGDHPDVASALNDLANLRHDLRDLDAALELHEASLAMNRRLYGDDHPSLADSYNNIAALIADRKDFAGALAMYERTLALDSASLGEDHPYVHADRLAIGAMQGLLGRTDEAEASLRQALADIRRVSGDEHPQALNATRELGILLAREDRCDEAQGYLEEALPGLERAFPGNTWQVTTARTFLGKCLAIADPEAGEALMRQAHARLVETRGHDDRMTNDALGLLAQFLRANGRASEALALERSGSGVGTP